MVDPGESLNGFITYLFDDPIYVDDWFFVGWRQRSNTYLNAGIDFNTPHAGRQYYYINGLWNQSEAEGSLMIRPVVGKPVISTDIDYKMIFNNTIEIWPNPVKDILNIELKDLSPSGELLITVIDTQGRRVISDIYTGRLDIQRLPEGVYFLVVTQNGIQLATRKFIRIN